MAGQRRELTRGDNQRKWVFVYTVIWILVIAWLGWMVATNQPVFGYLIPGELKIIPTAVPWYGALGGALISLVGIHEHRYDWDRRYWTWYLARPLVGAFVAVVAVLIFQSGVLAIGVNPDQAATSGPKDLFYYVIAFATGYREDAFRNLLRKVVDILFTSKDSIVTPTISEVDPSEGPVGTAVAIRGSGFKGVQVVRFGTVDVEEHKPTDSTIQTMIPAGLEPGEVDVTVATGEASVTRSHLFKVTA
ncbi:MAG: IPT/TIG domain-containing protein [Chloroflexi bacterium]|nr:IPT/TIG domain-containing protein [Chloroflexota bacterium]